MFVVKNLETQMKFTNDGKKSPKIPLLNWQPVLTFWHMSVWSCWFNNHAEYMLLCLCIIFNVPNFFISRCLTLRCKLYFDNLLAQRDYCGKMNFDHKNETLTISVSMSVLCMLIIRKIS